MANNNPESKTCEKCGETFGCGAKLDVCWCFDLKIPDKAATNLKQRFEDCLCPSCLNEYSDIDSTTETPTHTL